jgi:dCMP deaminase
MRISRQQMFMEMAEAAAKRSTCFRLNVGAIIVSNNNVLSIGYNGPPSGAPHCTGNDCPGKDHCKLTIHAEQNAIDRASGLPRLSDMYVTDSPCPSCASLIARHKFRRLFFRSLYRITAPVDMLSLHMEVYQVTPAGFVIDWKTREFAEIVR